jgi:hypothetical protein
MAFDVVTMVLSAAVADNGTITVSYPTGKDAGAYYAGRTHKMYTMGSVFTSPEDFTVSFGTSSITVTYLGATTIPAESTVRFQFDGVGSDKREMNGYSGSTKRLGVLTPYLINLGAPDVADADGVCASQSITTTATINGALASSSVATFDQPRNVVAAWTTTAVMTVTGTDEYGDVVVESSASGTSMTGTKAFKTVTGVSVSTAVTSATVGTGDVLGLPVFLAEKGLVIAELQDGANATAGTVVAGVQSTPTATTGDIRGTYDPNAACDGSRVFHLVALIGDPSYLGPDQYDG